MENENIIIEKIETEEAPIAAAKPITLSVGVQFRPAGKIYTFTSTDPTLAKDEAILVDGEDGISMAFVASPPVEADEKKLPKNVRRIIKRAGPEEMEEHSLNREKALELAETCKEKVREHNLDMKLIDAEIVEGGKKVVFFFFAEQRVDFRGLVKDLAGSLKMRIEMRQVGARDESKMIGCLGPCGLATCCSTHLRSFKSISISMAKQQGLTPNPAKLTGKCGKLKCCLSYEHQAYQELRKGLPKLGSPVQCEKGCGKVIDLNILKRECAILLYGGGMARCPCSETKSLTKEEREQAIGKAREAAQEKEDAQPRRKDRNRPSDNRRGKRDDRKRKR